MPITELEFIKAFAEDFAAQHLDEYVELYRKAERPRKRKEINDPIWGTISLSAVEVAIVDSPLLQRLREIKQLGVVHWVYPGATHSRFEHTLGVLYQAQNLVAAINRIGASDGRPTVNKDYEQLLKIAALMHDTGHAAFSHVSEFALNEVPEIIAARFQFQRSMRTEEKQLSEIVAFYIVRSPAFRRLVDALFAHHDRFISLSEKHEASVALLIEKVSDAIIGRRISDEIPILHEVISGPFDADKLDYFTRDSKYCGTPSVVDISRLIQKMAVRQFPTNQLPEAVARSVKSGVSEFTLFGIKWSGIPVLDELHLARVLLYSKVYKHGKVTAIEQMLTIAIKTLVETVGWKATVGLVYRFGDAGLLSMGLPELCAALGVSQEELAPEKEALIRRSVDLLRDLRLRRLHMKAFQALRNFPSDRSENADEAAVKMIKFRDDLKATSHRPRIISLISGTLQEINNKLDGTSESAEVLATRFSVAVAGATSGGTQVGRAFLIPDSGKPIQFSNYTVNRGGWADAYLTDQPLAYVFSEESIADRLFVAIERVLRSEYDLVLPESAIAASKRQDTGVRAIKESLAAKSFYAGVPHDIRPMPGRLMQADIGPKLEALEAKFLAYEIPDTAQTRPDERVDRGRILDWLRQFEHDHFIECALRCLEHFKVLRRQDTVSAVRDFIKANGAFRGAPIIGFGEAKDSGAVQAYFAADTLERDVSAVSTLSKEAEKRTPPSHILFIDDFIGSGGQSLDILAAGLGIDGMRQNLGEQRELFNEKEIELLKAAKCGFIFAAGWSDGASKLETAARSFGIDGTVFVRSKDSALPYMALKADDYLSDDEINEFKTFCESLGRDLISTTSEETDTSKLAEKADQRWLGYGNKGLLLSSTVNTPSHTWTPIWSSGSSQGLNWLPLLPRRKKL